MAQSGQRSINRTILECKFELVTGEDGGEQVLIEPYWNVNTIAVVVDDHVVGVLIEPYWNVNISRRAAASNAYRSINRTILECKYDEQHLLGVRYQIT